MSTLDPTLPEIRSSEANDWWRRNEPAGALMNKLMLLFIAAPIALVFKEWYLLSFIVFAFMVPYGFLVRRLAAAAVRARLMKHPEEIDEFRKQGVIL